MDEQTSKVLIVDDDRTNLKILTKIVESQGYETENASGGNEALSLLETLTPDLILLDIMMPDINGIEVCKKLQQDPRLSDIPVIMVTGDTDVETLKKSFDAGATDFVSKYVNRVEFAARIRAAFRLRNEIRRRRECESKLKELQNNQK